MFIDELRMPVAAQQNAEIIEPGYDSLQLDSVYQKDCQRRFLFSDVIEKLVLEARYSVGSHGFSVFVEGQFSLLGL
jgi:hypothetical protein